MNQQSIALEKKKYSRETWRDVCQFHPHSDANILDETLAQIQSVNSPILLLDLDSTLYEVSPRTFQILKEWVDSAESAEFSLVRAAFDQMLLSQVGYSIEDTLTHLGLSPSHQSTHAALHLVKRYWADRFFTNEYLKYDRAYKGSSNFVKKAYEAGAEIVYLTGRDAPGMKQGTTRNLLRDEFPWELPRTHLLMKPEAHLHDLEFKKSASQFVYQKGNLVASFENEPPNVVALFDLFPHAMHIFVDTVCSSHETEACHGLYRLRSYV